MNIGDKILSEECPVRDKMWVENGCSPTPALPKREVAGRAVRYATSHGISRPYGTFREGVVTFFYPHSVPNGTPYLDKFQPLLLRII